MREFISVGRIRSPYFCSVDSHLLSYLRVTLVTSMRVTLSRTVKCTRVGQNLYDATTIT